MISKTIEQRRAVYPVQYNNEPISREEITKILEAANWAPTHKRTEPWRFKVFHGDSQKKLAEFLSEAYKASDTNFSERKYKKYKENPVKAACVIAICFQRDPNENIPEWEEIAATSMAVQNMWLRAHELGIGAYWGSPAVSNEIHKLIEMPESEKCLGFFYLGKFDEELPEGTRQTSIEAKTIWV